MRWPMATSGSSWRRTRARSQRGGWKSEISPNLPASFARDNFGSVTKACPRVGLHGQAALEGARAISSADPGAEDEGVAAVEGDGWLDVRRKPSSSPCDLEREPLPGAPAVGVLDRQPTTGSTRSR